LVEYVKRLLQVLRAPLFKQTSEHNKSPYRRAIESTLLQQFLILGLTSMILDGGAMCCICFYAAVGFWTGVIIIRARRPIPTRVDLAVIQGGYIPLCLISFACAGLSHQ
jgi:hypothetical protein